MGDKHKLRVFEFVLRRDGVTGIWRKPHNEWYSLPSIIRMIKSRRMRWVGHVARMTKRNACIIMANNIKMDLTQKTALVNKLMHFSAP
jgi:hypothetical protein